MESGLEQSYLKRDCTASMSLAVMLRSAAVQGGPRDWRRFELRVRQQANAAAPNAGAEGSGALQLDTARLRAPDVPAFLSASQDAVLATGEPRQSHSS